MKIQQCIDARDIVRTKYASGFRPVRRGSPRRSDADIEALKAVGDWPLIERQTGASAVRTGGYNRPVARVNSGR
jgi:hypothetical protein